MATQSLGITNDRKRPGRQQSTAGGGRTHTLNTCVLSLPLPHNWAELLDWLSFSSFVQEEASLLFLGT